MTDEEKTDAFSSIVIAFSILFLAGIIIPTFYVEKSNIKSGITKSLQSSYREPLPEYMDDVETPAPDYRIVNMRVTAYCPCKRCCYPYSDGVTSTGKNAYSLGVAVDPKFIPYGTVIDIPGYGIVEADDCGGSIEGKRLDVRFSTHQEALNWGVKNIQIKIYRSKK